MDDGWIGFISDDELEGRGVGGRRLSNPGAQNPSATAGWRGKVHACCCMAVTRCKCQFTVAA